VLIVSDDRCAVEADLAAGRLCCPRCRVGVLGGWGCARLRVLRTREGQRRLRPRRGRCREVSCLSTHVLLPDVCLARRQDAVEVIGEALLCSDQRRRARRPEPHERPNGTPTTSRRPQPYFVFSFTTPHHHLPRRRHHHPRCPSTLPRSIGVSVEVGTQVRTHRLDLAPRSVGPASPTQETRKAGGAGRATGPIGG
jgi:hypothetical protein